MRDRVAISYAILAICVFKFLVWADFIWLFWHPTQLVAPGQKADFIVRESSNFRFAPLDSFHQHEKELLLLVQFYEETKFQQSKEELFIHRHEAWLKSHRREKQVKLQTEPVFVYLPFLLGVKEVLPPDSFKSLSLLF